MLEPILVKFEIINLDDESLLLYSLFNENHDDAWINIYDTIGNNWHVNLSPGDYIVSDIPSNTIFPNDTLVIGMRINNWGEQIRKKEYVFCFDQMGYFPPNRMYKVNFRLSKKGKSNDVNFEVNDINEEDTSVIKMYQEGFYLKQYDSVISKYPNSVYTEYIVADNLLLKYSAIRNSKDGQEFPELINEYEKFFVKYPNSYYVYYDEFMFPYFTKLYYNSGSYKKIVKDIKSKNLNANLTRFLNNRILLTG